MFKQILAVCTALAAFAAFAVVPATASAENTPLLTHPTGTALSTGTKITGTNVGEFTFTSGAFNLNCGSAYLTGEVTENNGQSIRLDITEASINGTGTEGDCTSGVGPIRFTLNPATNGLPWCLASTPLMATDEFQMRGNACTIESRPIRFALDITELTTCTYQRSEPISGTFTTHPEDAILAFSEVVFLRVGTNFLCPTEGRIDMSFTLETDTTESNDPLYIS